jgi:hypothetical protein
MKGGKSGVQIFEYLIANITYNQLDISGIDYIQIMSLEVLYRLNI